MDFKVKLPIGSVESARSSDEEVSLAAWEAIRRACERYLRSYPEHRKLHSDIDDIVDEAIIENLEAILSPRSFTDEVAKLLARSLNRHRSRAIREGARQVPYPPGVDVFTEDSDVFLSDTEQRSKELAEVVSVFGQFLASSMRSLGERDYSLLSAFYGFEIEGRVPNLEIYKSLAAAAKRVALFRARRRLLDSIERLLQQAAFEAPELKPTVDAVRRIADSGSLSYLIQLASGRPVTKQGPETSNAVREVNVSKTEVSPPAMVIVWDPGAITETDYLDLVSALGDLVRSEGGIGIQLLDAQSLGVEIPVGVKL